MPSDAYNARLARVNDRLAESGMKRVDLARLLARDTPSGYAYMTSVLRGETTSAPVLDKIEAALSPSEGARAEGVAR